jgi:hypothetical protein
MLRGLEVLSVAVERLYSGFVVAAEIDSKGSLVRAQYRP